MSATLISRFRVGVVSGVVLGKVLPAFSVSRQDMNKQRIGLVIHYPGEISRRNRIARNSAGYFDSAHAIERFCGEPYELALFWSWARSAWISSGRLCPKSLELLVRKADE